MASTSRSGTIITLALLIASMSAGAYVLILMETDPAKPSGLTPLWAGPSAQTNPELALIRRTAVPLRTIKWDNVVIHHAACNHGNAARGCHFLISGGDKYADGHILATARWNHQRDGDHVRVPGFDFNANSIGVCLLAAPGRTHPTARQLDSLIRLVRAIQVSLAIPADRVYLHQDLGEVHCPGDRIDAAALREMLVSATP